MRANGYILTAHCHLTAVITIPYRDTMSPPELARDWPVMNIFQPVHVNFVEAFRYNLHQAILDLPHCSRCDWCHFAEPLLRDQRLNHRIAARAVTLRHH